jgi:tetratricopeptide (TPR) repeat protein
MTPTTLASPVPTLTPLTAPVHLQDANLNGLIAEGDRHLAAKDYAAAERSLQRLLIAAEASEEGLELVRSRALGGLACVAEQRGDIVVATRRYREAIALLERPGMAETPEGRLQLISWRNNYAVILRASGRLNEAEAQYIKAINVLVPQQQDREAELSLLFNNLGSLYMVSGVAGQAAETFEKAILLSESGDSGVADRARLRYNAGLAWLCAKDYGRAADHLRSATGLLSPRDFANAGRLVEARVALASCYQKLGQPGDALKEYLIAIDLQATTGVGGADMVGVLWQNAGVLYQNAGLRAEALDAFHHALEARESSLTAEGGAKADAHYQRALALAQAGERDLASWHLERAGNYLADAAQLQVDREAAVAALRAALGEAEGVAGAVHWAAQPDFGQAAR